MAFRRKLSRSKSRKLFKKTSSRVHRRNLKGHKMSRGGTRL